MLELDLEGVHVRRCFRLAAVNGKQGLHAAIISFAIPIFSPSSVIATI